MSRPPAEWFRILSVLSRIESLLVQIGRAVNIEGEIMSELDDKLTAVQAAVADLATDVDRELTDLRNALAGSLSADQEAAFQALSDKIAGIKTAVDTADPAPVPVAEPAPAGDSGGTAPAA